MDWIHRFEGLVGNMGLMSIGLWLTLSCGIAMGQGHDIKLKISDISEDSAIIGYHFGKQRHVLDTLTFEEDGTLTIKGEEPLPHGVYFLYSPSMYFEFLVKDQEFRLTTTLEGGYRDLEVEGSFENQLFKTFQNRMAGLQQQQRRLNDSLSSLSGSDSLVVRDKMRSLALESSAFRDSLLKAHPDTYFSGFVNMMRAATVPDFEDVTDEEERKRLQYRHFKDHYFDFMKDPGQLLRTPVLHDYVMRYFDELVLPQPDSLISEIDRWLSSVEDNDESFRYWLVTLFKKYQDSNIMGMDAVIVHLAEKYYLSGQASWMNEESLDEIRKEVRFIKPNLIGKAAPDFYAVDTTLSDFRIGDLNDKYLILYFYDPDCGHCKKKTPILRDHYSQIRELGGEVVAVCTISDVEKWKSYVRTNDLNWINLGDPYGKSKFRVDYNVRSTPQLYVLDRDRKIIAKKLDVGEQLINFLKDHREMNP